jgi:hypothetical protein
VLASSFSAGSPAAALTLDEPTPEKRRVMINPSFETHQNGDLCAVLVDLLTERVASPEAPVERAEVIISLMSCALDAVRWRLMPYGDQAEEESVEHILAAAMEHKVRMLAHAQAKTDRSPDAVN